MPPPAKSPFRGSSAVDSAGPSHVLWRRLIELFLSRRFATFVVFGGLAAIVNLAVGRTLYTVPQFAAAIPYWLAVGTGSACGLLVNFALNYALNFRYFGRSAGAQLRTFTVVSVGGVILTAIVAQCLMILATTFALTEPFQVGPAAIDPEFAAHIMATGAVMFYSFTAHSAFSFNVGLRRGIARVFGQLAQRNGQ